MELLYDIVVNLLSDGIIYLLGLLLVILFPFLKKSICIKKLIQNTRNYYEVLMNTPYLKKTFLFEWI